MTVLVNLLSIIALFEGGPVETHAKYSKEQLAIGIEHRLSLLESSEMKYSYKVVAGPGKTTGAIVPEARVRVVRAGPRCLVDIAFPPQDGGRHVYSTDRREMKEFDVAAGNLLITPGSDTRMFRYDALSMLLGVALADEDRATMLQAVEAGNDAEQPVRFLPAAFASDEYIVADEREVCDGVSCVVISVRQPLRLWYKLWVDPEREFAVVRMDFVTGPDYPITRTYFREWRPVGATSFPMQVVHESYHPPTQELAYTQTFTVEAVRIGGVAPEEADLAIRSGMVVHDQVNDKSYVKSGPPDQHFLAAVNAARAEMGEHMKISRGDRPSSATSTRARNLLITVNAIAIGFLVIALFARKWLKGRKRQVQ